MGALYTLAARAHRRWLRLKGARTLGARAIVRRPDGHVVLVRHHYIDGWYLPGGGVDRGEGQMAALARELREELGIERFAVARILGVYHATGEGRDDHVLVAVVDLDADAATRVFPADQREIAEIMWCAPDAPPAATSPATRRRLVEHVAGATGSGAW